MAAHLTDKQKKKIIADYVQLGSYNATAKKNGVADSTVKRVVLSDPEMQKKVEQKKEKNSADILAHMESQREKVCDIIDLYLDELLKVGQFEKLTPSQLTTALGTLIDKWTAQGRGNAQKADDDPLTKSLKEMMGEKDDKR